MSVHEANTDDALLIAEQWQKDLGASADATILAAGLIWLAGAIPYAAKAIDIPASIDVHLEDR